MSTPKGVARLKLMLFAGWSPAWPKCSLCCRKGLWSSHYVWQKFSLGGNWALARLLTGWNYSCFMAYNQMLARHHREHEKLSFLTTSLLLENAVMGKLCSEQTLTFLRSSSCLDAVLALCETLQAAWAAVWETKSHCSRAYLWNVMCTSLLRYSHLDKMKYLQLACM